jgi:hypothetical protein
VFVLYVAGGWNSNVFVGAAMFSPFGRNGVETVGLLYLTNEGAPIVTMDVEDAIFFVVFKTCLFLGLGFSW